MNGEVVLRDVDIVKEAGGRHKALVKEIDAVTADKLLTVEFIPPTSQVTERTAPVLSGIELFEKQR